MSTEKTEEKVEQVADSENKPAVSEENSPDVEEQQGAAAEEAAVEQNDGSEKEEQEEHSSKSELHRFILKNVKDRKYSRRRSVLALSGLIEFAIKTDSGGENFFLDWRGEQVELVEGKSSDADCCITLTEDNLRKIASGNLNPQIAICSGKVRLEGRGETYVELGMYSFNLFTGNS